VTIGTFDGLHVGHWAILDRLAAVASQQGLRPVALAFGLPPRCGLARRSFGGRCLVLSIDLRAALLASRVREVQWLRFADVRAVSAETFVRQMLCERLRARVVVVGESFRFGRHRAGDVSTLRRAAGGRIAIEAVRSEAADGATVSSSRIRALVARGEVASAAKLLGRSEVLAGRVVRGDRVGRTIGFPTANIAVASLVVLPADGVYLAYAYWRGGEGHGMLYVGRRPTIGGATRRVELHLLDAPDAELLGERLEVHVVRRLRSEARFAGLDALQAAIARDRDAALEATTRGEVVPTRILG